MITINKENNAFIEDVDSLNQIPEKALTTVVATGTQAPLALSTAIITNGLTVVESAKQITESEKMSHILQAPENLLTGLALTGASAMAAPTLALVALGHTALRAFAPPA
jgi:hypothetical protein